MMKLTVVLKSNGLTIERTAEKAQFDPGTWPDWVLEWLEAGPANLLTKKDAKNNG